MSNKKNAKELDILAKEYNLCGVRSSEPQFYLVQHEVITHTSNGKPKLIDNYKMRLKCEPRDRKAGEIVDKYTCVDFFVKRKNTSEVSIPSLAGWSYEFSKQLLNEEGLDSEGRMMGIPHARFDGLTYRNGAKLPIELPYQIYSLFTYFHTCCNMLTEPSQLGVNIEDLRKVGDSTISEISPELPIDLGKVILKGSTFKTGKEALEFKGLGIVDDVACAIVGYEATGGSWTAYIQAAPLIKVKTTGGTQNKAEIYIDLASLWVKKATYMITDITKTTMYGIPVEISVPITTCTIQAVPEAEF